MKKKEVKEVIVSFIQLLDEAEKGIGKGIHRRRCPVFINTLINISDVATLNGIDPQSLKVRKSWKKFFKNKLLISSF